MIFSLSFDIIKKEKCFILVMLKIINYKVIIRSMTKI